MLEQVFDTSLMLNMVMNNLTSLDMFSLQNSALKQKKTPLTVQLQESVYLIFFTPVEIFCTAIQLPHTQWQS